jgi:HEAT repeat protein
MLKSEDAKDRFIAAKLLEDLKDPDAIPGLRDQALSDTDTMAANMAGHALALMGDPRTADTLREIADKKRTWEAEVNSLWGLVNLGDAQGIERAGAFMNDEANNKSGRAALGANVAALIHTPDVMPIVDRTARDFYYSDQVMGIVVDYYAALGSPEGRTRLQAIVDDTRVPQAARDAARQALAR